MWLRLFRREGQYDPFHYSFLATMSAKNIQEIYRHTVHHLDSVHRQTDINIQFDFDGNHTWFCSSQLPRFVNSKPTDTPIDEAILIFEVVGRISKTKTMSGPDSKQRTSFWIECENNTISRSLWGQIPKSLGVISNAAGIKFSFSNIFEVDPASGVMRLQVFLTQAENVSYILNSAVRRRELILIQSIRWYLWNQGCALFCRV